MEHSILATGTKELNFRLFFGMMIHGKEKACGDGHYECARARAVVSTSSLGSRFYTDCL